MPSKDSRAPMPGRFTSKVDDGVPAACWPWMAGFFTNGYGQFWHEGKQVKAHRVAYELANGPIPPGLIVLHTCDNKACCNPAHLIAGTWAENSQDRERKGRSNPPRGTIHHNTALTDDAVRDIRRLYLEGVLTQQDIADNFGVSQATISRIVYRVAWKHID